MTEAEWLTCADPKPMLDFMDGRASNRRLWLVSCGICRRHLRVMEARCRRMVQISERYADGQAAYDELMEASEEAFCRRNDLVSRTLAEAVAILTAFAVVDTALGDSNLPKRTVATTVKGTCEDSLAVAELSDFVGREHRQIAEIERSAQADIIRDVMGNLFRPVALDSIWLTPTVLSIARSIYDECAFERMPELAEALDRAGCMNGDILGHCRGPGPHVRGCWVIDLILRKE